ncbi:MAG: hypothetical protein COY72_01325 [Candidatus Nealsonbacteria bacterium CG_4_10_14_0_8_um_filter_35_10]|uniref:ECF transporter S component n=2 Tax=Candidatus Nealsoniibacteriota TaxID=1817911 RepID=A0A2M7R7Q3_9BACT|nr:MAG: hypothetical protein COY72_01325 [Candidatus Nealsonbacteria bacterium CG_4_10_14_0_8_um_filter_35_10]
MPSNTTSNMKRNISKTGKIIEFLVALFLIFLGAILRLLPHPPNFAPISAIALFGGVYFSGVLALVFPILAMPISDYFIGFYQFSLMSFVYLGFIISVFLGFWLKKNKKWYTIFAASLFSSILFFILTNFAVWAFTNWYPKDFQGFIQCYLMAIPFFKNTVLGDLFYVTLFFGIYQLAEVFIVKKFKVPEKVLISKK